MDIRQEEIAYAILRLFKAFIPTTSNANSNSLEDIKYGVIFEKGCPKYVREIAMELYGFDEEALNNSFHKSFGTMLNESEEKLVFEQILHYITTYGAEAFNAYDGANVFIPKEKLKCPKLKEDIQLTLIRRITKTELKKKLEVMIKEPIAYSRQTVNDITTLFNYLDFDVNIVDEIKNKELKNIAYRKFKIVPEDPNEFMRFFIYELIDSTVLIKDAETISRLKDCSKTWALKYLRRYENLYGLEPLAQNFNRYKKIYIALKADYYTYDSDEVKTELCSVINKISHLSKKCHKPMKISPLERFIPWCEEHKNEEDFETKLRQELDKATIWKIIKLRNYINYMKLKSKNMKYNIRNGKVWVKIEPVEKEYVIDERVENILDEYIVSKLSSNVKDKTILLPKDLIYAIPSSEKTFVGNIPENSSIDFKRSNMIIGIHWFNTQNNRVDLDLKIIAGNLMIGWDADYNDEGRLIFSGDMVDAPRPLGASEYMYVSKDTIEDVLQFMINNYSLNNEQVYYDIIIAKAKKSQIKKNYVVDTNDIIVKIPNNPINATNAQMGIGMSRVIKDNIRFIFSTACTGKSISASKKGYCRSYRAAVVKQNNTCCKLNDYLEKAGAKLVYKLEEDMNIDIDLTTENLNKDTIISMFR